MAKSLWGWAFSWWLMSRKKGKCERNHRGSPSLFFSFLAYFGIKKRQRGGGDLVVVLIDKDSRLVL